MEALVVIVIYTTVIFTGNAFAANTIATGASNATIINTNHKSTAARQHQSMPSIMTAKHSQVASCEGISVNCAETVTSAFAPNGDLWRLWVLDAKMYFQISSDNGLTFSSVRQVAIDVEKISARHENRPKIAFDNYQGVYLSWASPREKKYTADIRFSYSENYGKSFTKAVTVNNDNLLAGHSFNELLVTDDGDISIVWLDGRLSYQLRRQGKKSNGSALFFAQANYRKNQNTFSNEQLANNTCVCCRIAMTYNQQEELAIFWRHIYGDNIREFALLTVPKQLVRSKKAQSTPVLQPIQISHDHWQINGCPHQGGGLSIADNNRYHMVWFNLGDKAKGIFYAYSDDQGNTMSKPLSIGDFNAQAAHPNISHNGSEVDIVWTQFNGEAHQLWHQKSMDKGKTFGKAKPLAQSNSGSDRPFIIQSKSIKSTANSSTVNYVSWHQGKAGHLVQAL